MVATHKHNPIVRLPHPLVVAIEDTLVIPFLFEAEPAITSNECKDRKILLILQMEIEKSNIFIQLFGNVNTMLYLCTLSIAPIVERKILTCTPQCIRLRIPMLRNRRRS